VRIRVSTLVGGLIAAICCGVFTAPQSAQAATYEVGPGKALTNIGDVPWESLQAGDTVLIYWRSTPYKEKWVICRQGTEAAPITVRGVLGPNGERPVIDGSGATTRRNLNYWNEVRGVIKIGGASVPADTMPRYITLENLDIRSARPPYTFTSAGGSAQTYAENAAAVYVEKGENITVRNCAIHDSGNGLFVGSGDTAPTRNVLVEASDIYDNGIEGSIYQHNNYTEALGITFQYNRFGPLRAGCGGNNLKDRSAGLVVRYNWIEGGNRQLDLVESTKGVINGEARYRATHVYGNVLVEPDAAGNRQIVHYGGDNGDTSAYRKGTLYFYNNTVASARTDRTTIFRLSTNEERADARNNIFYVTAAGNTLSVLDSTGTLDLSRNWFKPGWVNTFGTLAGIVNNDVTSVQGASPGFVDEANGDYRLAAGSAAANAGGALHPNVLPAHDLTRQYVKHLAGEARANDGLRDIGAFELQNGAPAPEDLSLTASSLPNGTVGAAYSATLAAAGGVAPYLWAVTAGSLPAGLTLNAQTGAISGTPASAGTASFTVQLTDAQSPAASVSAPLSITVNPAPSAPLTVKTESLPNARRSRAYSQTLVAAGGAQPYAWSLASGSLPPGLALNAATGTISGTPTNRGTWRFTVRVQDSQPQKASATRALSLTVTR
jgi:hypothetical protein